MKRTLLLLLLLCMAAIANAEGQIFPETNDVTWAGLGTDENSSMPLGNGDVALNVWTEKNGDMLLLLAKTDSWSENGQLLKLGRIRLKLIPNPFAGSDSVEQTLKLENGEVQIRGGRNVAHIWVDANHPVVHIEIESQKPLEMEAKSEIWRTESYHLDARAVSAAGFFEWGANPNGLGFEPDTVLPARHNVVCWYHFNTHSIYPLVFEREHLASLLPKYPDPLLHRCFGVAMKGGGLQSKDNQTLKSVEPKRLFRLDLHALTQQVDKPESWQAALASQIAAIDATSVDDAAMAHQKWWADFWNRSWIRVTGTSDAGKVSQGYAIQRFMTACAGRGAQPIKFNGSLFTVGHDLPRGAHSTERNHDPDYRAWGACFWNQNVRLVYWPLIETGDYDLLTPWFNMYVKALPLVKDRTQLYFHHGGGAFVETIYFWGLPNVSDFGWSNQGMQLQSTYMRYHVQGALEVIAQMLDRYDHTQDTDFATSSIVPMADAVVTFYNQHWKRGADGKVLFEPAQSIETYQIATNPTPDIAGLMSILPRLLALPTALSTDAQRQTWKQVLADLPPIPMGRTAKGKLPRRGKGDDDDGQPTILPALKYGPSRNTENPELYTIFPYRIYGVDKPDLQLARTAFKARVFPFDKCWGQDGTQAAGLGLTADAQKTAIREFTSYGNQRFLWFWSKNNDWIPDVDNGGSGMITLQHMLMQCDGRRIQLLPAWPLEWTADFKLHAPFNTTVEGHVENGKLSRLKVVPEEREKDIVVMPR